MSQEKTRIIKFKKEEPKEKFFKDKFKLKALTLLLKEEFPLGFKIEHSLIKEWYSKHFVHYIAIEAKIDESSGIYSSEYGTKRRTIN